MLVWLSLKAISSFAILHAAIFPHETSSWLILGRHHHPTPRRIVVHSLPSRVDTERSSNRSSTGSHPRNMYLDNGDVIEIISRTVHLKDDWYVTVWEKYQPAASVEHYWNTHSRAAAAGGTRELDPFGFVNWPGSIVAAQELQSFHPTELQNKTVVVLGAGTGVEVQAVAMLGATHVIATDYNPITLQLLQFGILQAGLENIITTRLFDLFSYERLPDCDVLIAADVMYSERLSTIIANRCLEARRKKHPAKILISDSQRFADFVPRLRKQLGDDSLQWEERHLDAFTGSGVMIDDDQTYDVRARVLLIGWDSPGNMPQSIPSQP